MRILLCDDHLVVRMGLSAMLSRTAGIEVCGEAENGLEAVEKALKLRPDVIIMDIMMPELDGAAATERILAEWPEAKIVVLTTFGSSVEVRRAVAAGAVSALVKDSSKADLVAALRAAVKGEKTFSPEIAAGLSSELPEPELSDRQLEIMRFVARGFSNKEIARELDIGPDCVKAHLKTIFARLGVSNRAEAVSRLSL